MYSTTFRSWTMQGHSGASGLDTQDYAWMVEGLDKDPNSTEADFVDMVDLYLDNAIEKAEAEIRDRYEDHEDGDKIQDRIDEMVLDLQDERQDMIDYLVEWNRS